MYEQNQVLEDLNDFNRKLQSIVSHDLKSPIGATRHFLNYISNGELTPEEILVWSESISKSLELSEKLVMSLADLGLNNFNHSEQEKQTIELNSFVQGIIEDVASQTQLKKNKMVNKIGEMNLSINANLLEFIIRNLLQNANKFTKQGAICTKAIRKEKHILIIIQDNGQGIEAHKIKDIFAVNKFKSSVGTDGETGTGLGLAICQDFVTRMNGKIWVESEVNKGSTFYIKLPLFNA
jgi:signal transduction histidine kinase